MRVVIVPNQGLLSLRIGLLYFLNIRVAFFYRICKLTICMLGTFFYVVLRAEILFEKTNPYQQIRILYRSHLNCMYLDRQIQYINYILFNIIHIKFQTVQTLHYFLSKFQDTIEWQRILVHISTCFVIIFNTW